MKTLVGIPAMSTCASRFAFCLRTLKEVGEVSYRFIENSLVYDARDSISALAVNGGYDYLLFIDSDMVFNDDLLIKLMETAENEQADLVTALFFTRRAPVKPSLYSDFYFEKRGNVHNPVAVCMFDYPMDSVFPIAGCGMAATLIRVSAIKDVWEEYGTPFSPFQGFGEDFSFCMRLAERGHKKILCDSRVKVGHIGQFIADEDIYKAQKNTEVKNANNDNDNKD